jgi:hypothetical protein
LVLTIHEVGLVGFFCKQRPQMRVNHCSPQVQVSAVCASILSLAYFANPTLAAMQEMSKVGSKLPFAAQCTEGRNSEGFLMRIAAERWGLARPRPALENLPRRKPRGSWIDLWGKYADGWGDGFVRGSAEGAHDG